MAVLQSSSQAPDPLLSNVSKSADGLHICSRAATVGKAPKAWALPRFWVSILSYKKQPVKKFWGRILGLAWLKFAKVALKRIMFTFLK